MKKFISIFFAALLAVACVEPLQPYLGPVENEPEEDAVVTVEFSLPPMTKATWAHEPSISTIHVAVFNAAGVLKQFEKAKLTNPEKVTNGNNPAGNPLYSVDLHMSAKPRILHFIADVPETLDTYDELIAAAGTSGEDVILNAITTTNDAVAYWQRVELDRIDAYTYKGGICPYWPATTEDSDSYSYSEPGMGTITVNIGDYIKRDGKKVLDGTGYFQSDYVKERVANIPLIRNFAEIKVSKGETSNFTPVKFALVNVPTAGYVAPFDTKNGEFATAYRYTYTDGGAQILNETLTYSYVHGTNYPGTLAGTINTGKPETFILAGTGAFMYERPLPNAQQPATCILVAGNYDNPAAEKDEDGLTWFKIELSDERGVYFPIYRGVQYDVKIGEIDGTNGYDNADDAFNNDAIGDISNSVTTSSLEQISDGKGTTLWVEYIDYVATASESKSIYYTLFYQGTAGGTIEYLYDTIDFGEEGNSRVDHPNPNYKAISGNVVVADGTFTTGTPDETKQWKKATVTLAEPGTNTKRSILHIEGKTKLGKAISREVNYRVMGIQHFQNGQNVLNATPLASQEAGEETTLTIYLPSDLGMSMFPLDLRIEAQNGNFTALSNTPVETGPSLFDGKNTFYFLKTINYDEYDAFVKAGLTPTFPVKFKTTRPASANGTNATTFAVLDKVKPGRTTTYFEKATCPVTVLPIGISPIEQTVKGSDESATFRIVSNLDNITNFSWSITDVTGDATFDSTSGTSPQEVTMRFNRITNPNDAGREYTAKFSYSYTLDGETHSNTVNLKVSQSALVLRSVNGTVSFSNTNFSTGNSQAEINGITVSFSNINSVNDGRITINANNSNTVTFKAPNGINISGITITFRRARNLYYQYVNYNLSSEPNNFSGGTGNNDNTSLSTTYTGAPANTISTTLNPSNNGCQITNIQVTYSGEIYE